MDDHLGGLNGIKGSNKGKRSEKCLTAHGASLTCVLAQVILTAVVFLTVARRVHPPHNLSWAQEICYAPRAHGPTSICGFALTVLTARSP